MLATAPATTPASKVVMAVFVGASKRSMDSITMSEEASGAAKAAATPAAAQQLFLFAFQDMSPAGYQATPHKSLSARKAVPRPEDNPAEKDRMPPTNLDTISMKGCR